MRLSSLSARSNKTSRAGLRRAICRASSDPIDPAAPVSRMTRFRRSAVIGARSMFTAGRPLGSTVEISRVLLAKPAGIARFVPVPSRWKTLRVNELRGYAENCSDVSGDRSLHECYYNGRDRWDESLKREQEPGDCSVPSAGSAPDQYQPIGFSSRLMKTCFVSRYSSTPQCPNSRPKPEAL